jgi:hypothetical protein
MSIASDCTETHRPHASTLLPACTRACGHDTQILMLTFRTPAGKLVTLGWCISIGETKDAYSALLNWVLGMGGTVKGQQWSVRPWLAAGGMVVISDWAKALIQAVKAVLPEAIHL